MRGRMLGTEVDNHLICFKSAFPISSGECSIQGILALRRPAFRVETGRVLQIILIWIGVLNPADMPLWPTAFEWFDILFKERFLPILAQGMPGKSLPGEYPA